MNPGSQGDQADEIDLIVALYLSKAQGNAVAALRAAVADALNDAVEARLTILNLRRAASSGYLRDLPVRSDAEEGLTPARLANP